VRRVVAAGAFVAATAIAASARADGWAEQAELEGSGAAMDGAFGAAVAIGGGYIVVGAPGEEGGNGAAYVFTYEKGRWVETRRVVGFMGSPKFGQAVAIDAPSGTFVVADQEGADMYGLHDLVFADGGRPPPIRLGAVTAANNTGPVTVAARDGWVAIGMSSMDAVYAFKGAALDHTLSDTSAPSFGTAVAFGGDGTLFVGSPEAGTGGAVYAYAPDGTLTAMIPPPPGSIGRIGAAISIAEPQLFIGASGTTVDPAGHVEVFARSGNAFTYLATAPNYGDPETTLQGGGSAVAAVVPNVVAAGAPLSVRAAEVWEGAAGVVSILADAGAPSLLAPPNAVAYDQIGAAVAATPHLVVVGAPQKTLEQAHQGIAFVWADSAPNDGAPCASPADCTSTFCASGVCCNEACVSAPFDPSVDGGPSRLVTACAACSVEAGAFQDGVCSPLPRGTACGGSFPTDCQMPQTCDGVHRDCPVLEYVADGTPCGMDASCRDGLCLNGSASMPDAGASLPDDTASPSSSGCTTASSRALPALGLMGACLGALAALRRRRRR
jgi:hypothetical protein